MQTRILNYARAGYSGLYIVSHEETRVEALAASVVTELTKAASEDFTLWAWSVTSGIHDVTNSREFGGTDDPMSMLDAFIKAEERTILLARDFHLFMEDKNPVVWRKLRDALAHAKTASKCIIILGCRLCLPPELEKELTVIQFTLPDREQLRTVLHNVLGSDNPVSHEAAILAAASGLTTIEAENAFALSIIEADAVTPDIVYREKCQAVAKNGLLEVVDSKVTLDQIGGLQALKRWLTERKDAFSDEARAYGLPVPKGFMAAGQPGTGKSLTAKACRSVFGVPLLRLDGAKLFGSLVGQSEANWRAVHSTAKAMAPVVLWVDEVDGMFSGGSSSGQTDGGTTSRVIKSILQDMQENSEGIFYVFTANDIDNIPSPVLRRLDEVWNVELPNAEERKAIWEIQLKRVRRDPSKFDIAKLVEKSEQFSGSEIERLLNLALNTAFADNRREPTTEDLLWHSEHFSPLSKTMASDIERRRNRLKGVARLASETALTAPSPKPTRKLTRIGNVGTN